jgi:AGCS family alanine or glycine:cation symporter
MLRHPKRIIAELISGLKEKGARRSFFLALAGTLGVGNIFGVSAGIMIGGAGVVFWIFLSSIFSAVIKYAEVLLVFKNRADGGMAEVIGRSLPLGRLLSPLYAGLTLILSLFMGASLQSEALMDVAESSVGIYPAFTGIGLVILLVPAFVGGVEKIEKITEKLIPMTTIIYIIMCFGAIFVNSDRIADVISDIFSSALSCRAILGGGAAVAIREGFSRGIMSNEAGSGTSALAHSRDMERTPHTAGLFGICEVLFDTTILCTLTGVAILCACPNFVGYSTPMALVFAAFHSSLGAMGGLLLPIILCFAYSTVICWFYYGSVYCDQYFGGHRGIYLVLFISFILLTPILPSIPLLYLTDLILLLMSCLTLAVIVKDNGKIKNELPL